MVYCFLRAFILLIANLALILIKVGSFIKNKFHVLISIKTLKRSFHVRGISFLLIYDELKAFIKYFILKKV